MKISSKIVVPLIILIVVLVISYANYIPNTYLTGWDNLHPEFNFSLNIMDRSIFSVWQEYQGLGLLAVMAHASDFPRQIFLLILETILPTSFLRYFYQFAMLLLGTFGMYYLLVFLLKREATAFLGALFYVLNLGTVQTFYAPISMFTTFWGFFPFLILLGLKYLETPNRKFLLAFVVLNFLSAPMAYTPTLFLVYFFCSFLIYAFFSLDHKKCARSVPVLIAITAANAFWLFPFAYSTALNVGAVMNSKINTMASENSFLLNKRWGSFQNVALLKDFWFGNVDLTKDGTFGFMMQEWRQHLSFVPIWIIGYVLFAVVIAGFAHLVKSFGKRYLGFALVFLFSLFFLLNENFPAGFIYGWFRSISPVFSESFRFPFTKWVVPAVFSYSILFSFGLNFLSKYIKIVYARLGFYVLILVSLVFFAFPVFRGGLIYSNLRVEIPQEYFELFDFMAKQDPTERIANFPQYTFWGWNYYNWGYRGSGFLWYGIKQPILDRAFDVWSPYNEQYYNDISYALYSQNADLFYTVLNKYQVSWILVDKNVIQPEGYVEPLYFTELEKILGGNPRIVFTGNFGSIYLYRVLLDYHPQNFLSFESPQDYSVIRGSYNEFGGEVGEYAGGGYQIKVTANLDKVSGKDIAGSYYDYENAVPVKVYAKEDFLGVSVKLEPLMPQVSIDGNVLNVKPVAKEIRLSAPLSLGTETVLSIGGYFIELESLSREYAYFDTILLSTRGDSSLRVFQKSAKETLPLEDLDKKVYSCTPSDENSFLSVIRDAGGIKLTGKNSIPCSLLSFKFNTRLAGEVLYKVDYEYKSALDERPEYCLIASEDRECLNDKFGRRPGFSPVWSQYSDFTAAPKGSTNVDLTFALDALDYEEPRSIWYKNISLSAFKRVGESVVSEDFLIPKASYNLPKAMSKIVFSFNDDFLYKKIDAASNLHSLSARACDKFSEGTVGKSIGPNSITYVSKDDTNCEDFEQLSMPQDIGYLIDVKTSHISGPPLNFCLSNSQSKKCDIVEKLGTSNLFVEPAMSSSADLKGYVFHFDNISIGNDLSENTLYSVSSYYYPSLWFRYLFTRPMLGSPSLGSLEMSQKNRVLESRRYNPSIFGFSLRYTRGSILAFNQTYSKDWILFDLDGLRIVGGHRKVKGWANGWELYCGGGDECEGHYLLFYWPQGLEFLGATVLAGTIIILIIVGRRNPTRINPKPRTLTP